MKLWKKMVLALLLGVLSGLILKDKAVYLKPIGTAFLGLLNMLVVLLVFSSMSSGVFAMSDIKKLGRVGFKTLATYIWTTAVAIGIGLVFAKLINPGKGILLSGQAVEVNQVNENLFFDMLHSLIPSNPISAMANGHILQVIVFAILFGLAINLSKAKPLMQFMEALTSVMFKMTDMVMYIAPVGIFAIMAWVSGTFGVAVLYPLLKLVAAHYLACIVHAIVVFGGILVFLARVPVGPFFKGMADAIALAASTTSSSATLPATLHCTQENLGVSKNISNFMLPLGSTINMNGTAIFQALAAVFISQAYGVELTWINLLVIVVTATLSAVGCAGIPGGALVTLSIVLSAVGLPLEGVAIIAGIDRIRDIIGTVVNILGDGVVAVYVAKSENELDESVYLDQKQTAFEQREVA